jgi:hypothetical protein
MHRALGNVYVTSVFISAPSAVLIAIKIPKSFSLVGAVTTYLAEIQLTKKPKTLAAYTTALDYCLESCKAQHVTEIDRRHMLEFTAFLRDEKEQMPRSVYNKFENVMTFLKANKVRDIVGKTDWPDAVHYVL